MTGESLLFAVTTWLLPLVVAIILHEVSHGWVANAFGDPTAKRAGRLSLNPVRHVDPVGTIVLPLILAISGAPLFGWAKPVPVRPDFLRNPRWHGVLVSAAGPGMNLLLAVLATFAYAQILSRTGPQPESLGALFLLANLFNFIMINLFLAVFNMLPVPPLDGGRVLAGLLPPPLGMRFERLSRFGIPLLLIALIALPLLLPQARLFERIVEPPVRLLLTLLFRMAGGAA